MSTLRRDIPAAYLAATSRLASWIVVTALVYRRLGIQSFAILALVRTTIGLLNFTTLGLGPATVRALSQQISPSQDRVIYSSAVKASFVLAQIATLIAIAYALLFTHLHALPAGWTYANLRPFVAAMGLGTVARLASEPFSGVLQARRRIALDNLLIAAAEIIWLLGSAIHLRGLLSVGVAWLISGLFLLATRFALANRLMTAAPSFSLSNKQIMKGLLTFGILVAIAQAADFLYAPTDNILINRFINPESVALYAPAIQIDSGLLLLVAGLAAVLFPHGALAHAQGDVARVRKLYLTGTFASILLLATAAAGILLIAPRLFHRWLGDPLPATCAILPLILIHTVVGGSSAVGRSILLAIGRVRPFTIAALTAGAANVILSLIFVRYCGWGLRGIVLGTILAVTGRCAIWTPWYVLRSLNTKD